MGLLKLEPPASRDVRSARRRGPETFGRLLPTPSISGGGRRRLEALDASKLTRADRLHAAISTTFEGVYSAIDEASFERRAGHVRLLFPSVPIRIFNGVVVESEPCSGIADSIREVEERGGPCGVQVRAARHPAVEEEAAQLGLTARIPMPGMTVSPDELVDARAPGLDIVRVEDEEGLGRRTGRSRGRRRAPSLKRDATSC